MAEAMTVIREFLNEMEALVARSVLEAHDIPAVVLRDDAGANRRVPAFLVSERATLLPAFSPFAAGFDVSKTGMPKEMRDLLGRHRVYPVTGKKIAHLPVRGNG